MAIHDIINRKGENPMKLQVTKSKNAASFYITKSVYVPEEKRYTSVVVEHLGTEADLRERLNGEDPYEWGRNYAKELTLKEKEEKKQVIAKFSPQKRIPKNKRVTYNGGYLFLQKLYYRLGLHDICSAITSRSSFTFDLNLILSTLVYSRILFPASKRATATIAKSFLEPRDLKLHHIYRSLDVLAKEEDFIQAELYKNSLKHSKRNDKVLFYDCTNFYFEIEQEEGIKQYGKSKENRPNPIVEMGLFMDGDGIPLAFSVHPGNTNEQVTMKPLEQKILSDFELSRFIVCTDAGLSSAANRKFNDIQGRSFITTQSIKKLKKHLKEWALDASGWSVSGKNELGTKTVNLDKLETYYQDENRTDKERRKLESIILYKERWIKEDNLEQRLIVTYSLKYRNYQRKIRHGQVERAQKVIDSNPGKLKKCNPNDYKRFIKKDHCTEDGEKAENEILSIDQSIIDNEAIYDGFYGVCTNLEDEVDMIVNVNRGRWEIEECFRIMKSEFEARPIYLSLDERIKAHFMTCFISLIIFRLLEKELKPQNEEGEEYTCDEILTTLRELMFYEVKHEGFVPLYERTDFTDLLHERFGFNTDTEIVSKRDIKKIFTSTKKK